MPGWQCVQVTPINYTSDNLSVGKSQSTGQTQTQTNSQTKSTILPNNQKHEPPRDSVSVVNDQNNGLPGHVSAKSCANTPEKNDEHDKNDFNV